KTDRHYVKQFEEETNLRNYVVLDTSTSMRYRHGTALSKLEYGAYLAGALHYLMIRQRDATGLVTFDEFVQRLLSPRSTSSYLRPLLLSLQRTLDETPERRRTSAASVLREVAERPVRGSLVVTLTDPLQNVGQLEALLIALRHLRYRGHEVLVFYVLGSETERGFRFPDVPMDLRDIETGEE